MVDEYDSPWKEAIERYFADFMQFFFPAAHAKIDWTQPFEFLEQELRSVVRDAELGTRFVDKLARVSLLDGHPEWVYVHLEVQGSMQASFAERMFVYNYRLFDRYHCPVASLAVLADDQDSWRPTSYAYRALDCEMGIRFPVAKLLDWSGSEARLEDSSNPFAIVTRAHLATRATRDDPQARYRFKSAVVRSLYRRGWGRQQVTDLFRVIDWLMRLPAALEQQFRRDLDVFEEEATMRYVTSIERLAREEGVEAGILQGMQEGIQQGVQQGRIEGMRQTLRTLLERRFGQLPAWGIARLASATEAELEAWTDTFINADSVENVLGPAATRTPRAAS